MHYLFLDESYSVTPTSTTVIVAAWIVEQTAFETYVSRNRRLYRAPLMDSINSMLETLGAWALVARGSFEGGTYRIGERDSTDDIGDMARADNVWSQCVIFATGMLIRELIRQNVDIGIVDFYHDPKTLKGDHADAMAETLRGIVVSLAKQFTSDRKIRAMENLSIRHVEAIEKPTGPAPTRYQLGVSVADRLCSASHKNWGRVYSRIIYRDMSDVVRRTVQQFDGKPFHS